VPGSGDLYGHARIEALCEVFEQAGGPRDTPEAFRASTRDFLPSAAKPRVDSLAQETWTVPARSPFGAATLVPLASGANRVGLAARLTAWTGRRMPCARCSIFAAVTAPAGPCQRDRLPRHDELSALATPSGGVSGGGARSDSCGARLGLEGVLGRNTRCVSSDRRGQTRLKLAAICSCGSSGSRFREPGGSDRQSLRKKSVRVVGERVRGTPATCLTLLRRRRIIVAAADAGVAGAIARFRWKELSGAPRGRCSSMRRSMFGTRSTKKRSNPRGVDSALNRRCRARPARAPLAAAICGAGPRAAAYSPARRPSLDPQPVAAGLFWDSPAGPGQRLREYYDDGAQFRPRRSP